MSHSELELCSIKEMMKMFSLSRSTMYRLTHEKTFPKPIIIGPADSRNAVVRWRVSDLKEYLESRPREKTLDG
jgi:predicted DNA-binding transcriptional regulator AlpA